MFYEDVLKELDAWGARFEEATRKVLEAKAFAIAETKAEELSAILLQEAAIATTEMAVEEILESVADYTIRNHLEQVAGNNYRKIHQTTIKNVGSTIGLAIDPTDELGASIVSEGGRRMGLVDLDKATKKRLFRELEESRLVGEGPVVTARRIRDKVPAGRWKSSKIRARVIARTETLHAQRASQLATYAASGIVKEVMVFDDRLGFGDAVCSGLNGSVVTISSAQTLMLSEHPNGTRSFAPHISCRKSTHIELKAAGPVCAPLGSTKRPTDADLLDGPYKQGMKPESFGKYDAQAKKRLRTAHEKRKGFIHENDLDPKKGLGAYISGKVPKVNNQLRAGGELKPKVRSIIKDMTTKSQKQDEPYLLFRGLDVKGDMDFQKGTRVKMDAFSSTSADFNTAVAGSPKRGELRTMMEIHTPEGTRSIMTNSNGLETILMPGQELDILDVVKNVDIGAGRKVDNYVVARVVPESATKPKLAQPPKLPDSPKVPELPMDSPYGHGLTPGSFEKYDAQERKRLRAAHRKRTGFIGKNSLNEDEGLGVYLDLAGFGINESLRSGKSLSPYYRGIVDDMFTKSQKQDKPYLLFRGINEKTNVTFKKGTRVKMDAFSSTTPDLSMAVEFTQLGSRKKDELHMVMEIHTPTGTRSIMTNSEELETILMPGQELDIIDVIKNVDIGNGRKVNNYVVARIGDQPVPKRSTVPARPTLVDQKPVDPRLNETQEDVVRRIRGNDNAILDSHKDVPTYHEDFDVGDSYESLGDGMNSELREGGSLSDWAKGLNKDMHEASLPLQQPLRVFRGEDAEDVIGIIPLTVGDVVQPNAGWMSTSRSQRVAAGYYDSSAGRLWDIQLPEGTRSMVFNKFDAEVVLPPNTSLRILGVKKWKGEDSIHGYTELVTADVVVTPKSKLLPPPVDKPKPVALPKPAAKPSDPRLQETQADFVGRLDAETVSDADIKKAHKKIPTFQAAGSNDYLDEYVSSDAYLELNRFLRDGGDPKNWVKKMDKGLHKITQPLKQELRVFRGEPGDVIDATPFTVGDVIEPNAGWISTSRSAPTAEEFGGQAGRFWDIRLPEGTRSIVTNSAEAEVLLPPNARLRILGVEEWDYLEEGADFARYGERVIAEVVLDPVG